MDTSHTAPSPYWLLLAWLALALLQAAFSPLDADETYYWMYAQRLDWGYFDHPPAVALLVSLGKDWLPGALGLRFGHVLASTATIAALWYLLDRPRGATLWLAAALVFAQPMLNVYSFIATPDGPLLLFTVLYLLAYRRFLAAPTLANGALWGITMAAALYSKYHGVMLIFFSVLPHLLWLLRKPGAWLAALGGAALFIPHLYWQYLNDFPSFRYHLSGRNDPYELAFTFRYLLNQLVIFSPLLLWYYVQTFWKDRSQDRFDTANRWLVLGFLLFFLYTTLKGSTEAQWTALLSIPLVYLTFHAARDRFPAWQPGLQRLAWITVGVLLLARIFLVAPRDWLPFAKPFDHQPWVERLAETAAGRPVMVQNSYRLASLYEFYADQPAWTFTDVFYRRNQYDLWTADSVFHQGPVLVLGQKSWSKADTEAFRTQDRDMRIAAVEGFQIVKGLHLAPTNSLPTSLRPGERYPLTIEASFHTPPTTGMIDLRKGLPLDLFITFHYADTMVFWKLTPPTTPLLPRDATTTVLFSGELELPEDLPAGEVEIEWGLGYQGMSPLRGQSEKTVHTVEQ